MRIPLFVALGCAAMFAASPVDAMSSTKHFRGGSITCSTNHAVEFGRPHPFGKGPKGVRREVMILEEASGPHWYVVDVSTRRVQPRTLYGKSKDFQFSAWGFNCVVRSEQAAAHSCSSVLGKMSGSCTVCAGTGKDRCEQVSFVVNRHKLKQ